MHSHLLRYRAGDAEKDAHLQPKRFFCGAAFRVLIRLCAGDDARAAGGGDRFAQQQTVCRRRLFFLQANCSQVPQQDAGFVTVQDSLERSFLNLANSFARDSLDPCDLA